MICGTLGHRSMTRPALGVMRTQPWSCRRVVVSAAATAPAVAHGVVATAPPQANPMTPPPKEANQAAPAPAPTTSAKATQASAKTAAAPASTTTTQGTPSSNTTTTPTGSTGGKATTGTRTAAGVATDLTREERQAAECLAAVIGRSPDFVIEMAFRDKGILKEPFRTAYKHAVLARGASASPAWQAKLDAATPTTLTGWLLKSVPRLMRLNYLADKGLTSRFTLSAAMSTKASDWEAKHPDFKQWLQEKGVDLTPTATWPWSSAKRAAPSSNTSTTPTGSTATAAGVAAGLTYEECQAAACLAAVIGRSPDFVINMALSNKGILKQPFRTAYKHAVLARGASASPAWQAKLDAATPTTLTGWLLKSVSVLMRLTYLANRKLTSRFTLSAAMRTDEWAWKDEYPSFKQWLKRKGVDPARTATWPWSPPKRAAPAASTDPAVAHGVVATAPPKTNPMTAPRKEANQAAPAPAPTTSANATQASAKTAAPPASTTTTQGTPSSNTTTTPTGSTGGKATTGTTTAAGAAAGLTQDATVIVAVAINRKPAFVIDMAVSNKNIVKQEPVFTAYKHAVLAQGAAASPAWQAELAAATPAALASWLLMGVPRNMRLSYLADNGLTSGFTVSGVMSTKASDWEAQHPDFEQWLQEKWTAPAPSA